MRLTSVFSFTDFYLSSMQSFNRFFFSACLYTIPAFTHQALALRPGDDEVNREMVKQVSTFLQEFIDPGKSPQAQADFFTDNVEYYEHGHTTRKAIVQDVKRYSSRWPWRHYRLADIHYITPDPASDRVFVSYEIDYEVGNGSKTVTGKAYYGAVIANLMQAPRIEWIKEQVQPRKQWRG